VVKRRLGKSGQPQLQNGAERGAYARAGASRGMVMQDIIKVSARQIEGLGGRARSLRESFYATTEPGCCTGRKPRRGLVAPAKMRPWCQQGLAARATIGRRRHRWLDRCCPLSLTASPVESLTRERRLDENKLAGIDGLTACDKKRLRTSKWQPTGTILPHRGGDGCGGSVSPAGVSRVAHHRA